MKVSLRGNVTLEQIESLLEQGMSSGIFKITRKIDRIKIASNPVKGAVVTIKASDNFSEVKVTPQMPIALAMQIILLIPAVLIFLALGTVERTIDASIFKAYALPIAFFGPILLSHIVSRPFAKQCVELISKGLQT
jgi:hypothetical protein